MSKPKTSTVDVRTVEHRTIPSSQIELRFGNGPEHDGVFEGYANLWDVTDSYGTRFLQGAFRSGGLDDKPYALLWMHDPTHVVGTFTAREDERGLRIEGRFAATERGQEARALAQMGAAPELSVGFSRQQTLADDETGIVSAELVEVSLITARMASTPGAALTGVRGRDVERLGTRAHVPLDGSFEQLQHELGELVGAWANDAFGERSEENDWYAAVEATFADELIAVVYRWTPEPSTTYYRMPYSGDAGARSLGDAERVELSAVVTSVDGESAPAPAAGTDVDDTERARQLAIARLRLSGS